MELCGTEEYDRTGVGRWLAGSLPWCFHAFVYNEENTECHQTSLYRCHNNITSISGRGDEKTDSKQGGIKDFPRSRTFFL